MKTLIVIHFFVVLKTYRNKQFEKHLSPDSTTMIKADSSGLEGVTSKFKHFECESPNRYQENFKDPQIITSNGVYMLERNNQNIVMPYENIETSSYGKFLNFPTNCLNF